MFRPKNYVWEERCGVRYVDNSGCQSSAVLSRQTSFRFLFQLKSTSADLEQKPVKYFDMLTHDWHLQVEMLLQLVKKKVESKHWSFVFLLWKKITKTLTRCQHKICWMSELTQRNGVSGFKPAAERTAGGSDCRHHNSVYFWGVNYDSMKMKTSFLFKTFFTKAVDSHIDSINWLTVYFISEALHSCFLVKELLLYPSKLSHVS